MHPLISSLQREKKIRSVSFPSENLLNSSNFVFLLVQLKSW
jgi:hypothetical protein